MTSVSIPMQNSQKKIGVLVSNLGTPDAPRAPEVRRYLREFLSDPYVIDIPTVARMLLVHGIILRFRPKKSAEAYEKIWTDRGSPLLFHSVDLVSAVQRELGADYKVVLGMRYGSPSIESAFGQLASDPDVGEILFLPLYPQYSYAATLSSEMEFARVVKKSGWLKSGGRIRSLDAFYKRPEFIQAFQTVIQTTVQGWNPDHYLFSYHGVPERQIKRLDPTQRHCLSSGACCDNPGETLPLCYRAQSFSTTRELAKKLGLKPESYSISFQSRLGRTPWIRPYTDEVLDELAAKGVKRLAVVCPAFVADCLETLEEIAMRAREQFIASGGEDLILVPSLNSSPLWSSAISEWVQKRDQGFKELSPSL